jgi:PKD repeat protein
MLLGAGLSTAMLALSMTVVASTAVSATTHNRPTGGQLAATALSGTLSLDVYDYQNPAAQYQSVELYASAYNSDSTCSITNYSWDFGDGSSTSGPSAYDVYHSWSTIGNHTVKATVSDSCGNTTSSTLTQSVVCECPPVARFTTSANSNNRYAIYADPSTSTDSDPTGLYEYDWSWGDGTYSTTYQNSNSGLASHTYPSGVNKTYTVTLTAYDTAYNSGSVSHTVPVPTIVDPPPCSSSGVVEETCPAIAYTGSWTSASCTHTGCSANHTEKASVVSGNQAVLTFTGTKVVWKGSKGTQGGKAAVYVDGVLKATVSEYRSSVASGLAIYTSPLLARGTHTLKVKLTLNKRINIDDFVVTS